MLKNSDILRIDEEITLFTEFQNGKFKKKNEKKNPWKIVNDTKSRLKIIGGEKYKIVWKLKQKLQEQNGDTSDIYYYNFNPAPHIFLSEETFKILGGYIYIYIYIYIVGVRRQWVWIIRILNI